VLVDADGADVVDRNPDDLVDENSNVGYVRGVGCTSILLQKSELTSLLD
jgi:hypothetical protein